MKKEEKRTKIEIGQSLKFHRKSNQFTLIELSNKINVSIGNLSKMENGKLNLKLDLLQDLAILYDLSLEEVINHQLSLT